MYSLLFKRVSTIRFSLSRCVSDQKHSINKVLIANRGEIACRIMRTAKRMGMRTVVVYSEADKNSMHVAMADEAFNIGPAASQESYLRGEAVIDAASTSRCQAIHPGYGFLSENADFAELCEGAGITFVGPPASAIRDMGIKSTSKMIMGAAGVPIIEGYHGEDQNISYLCSQADNIGYPIMIKAIKGGGGKGMRIALTPEEFEGQLESAKRESLKSFGDDAVLLERYVRKPRHVEVQVFGDKHGNYVYLAERDCSLQRRHQKVIEEAPAPGVTSSLREKLGAAAVAAARAVNYVGAGTVEFIMDYTTMDFYFMEMNTRLQVEHPITEMITGTDLVEWQLKVAAGEPLPLKQDQITVNGHSLEARIYAEDPNNNFMPGAGPLIHLVAPNPSADVRVETGVRQGDEVSVHYDPMIAKLVVWGENRQEAIRKLYSRLADYNVSWELGASLIQSNAVKVERKIVGLETNVNFMMKLCGHKEFQNGNVHTGFIEQYNKDLFSKEEMPHDVIAQAAIASVLYNWNMEVKRSALPDSFAGFRINHRFSQNFSFVSDVDEYNIEIKQNSPQTFQVVINKNETLDVSGSLLEENGCLKLSCNVNGHLYKSCCVFNERDLHLFTEDGKRKFTFPNAKFVTEISKTASHADGAAVSPMPGVVDKVFVKVGDKVAPGDPLIVVIAMKMEHVIKAPRAGTIGEVLYKAGDRVNKNTSLIRFSDDL